MHRFCFHHSRRNSNLYSLSVVSVSLIQISRIFQVSTSFCHCLKFTCAGCMKTELFLMRSSSSGVSTSNCHSKCNFECLPLICESLDYTKIFINVCGYPTCSLWLTCQILVLRVCYAFTLILQILPCPTEEWPCAFKDYKTTNLWTPNCLMIETVSFQNNSSSR